MYAHVNTYRLGDTAETVEDIDYARRNNVAVTDQSARTIASWYQSPGARFTAITALASGAPFDTETLRDQVESDDSFSGDDRQALIEWLDRLELILSEWS